MDHHMNQTPQEPQPTKPTFNRDTNPDDHENLFPIPEETDSQEFNLPAEESSSDLNPQPSTPSMAHPETRDQLLHLEPPPMAYPLEKPPLKTSLSKRHFSPSTGKTPRGEKEAVAELLTILVDSMQELNTRSRESLLRKFFSEIERDERLEEFIVDRLRQSNVKALCDLCQQLPPSVGNSESSTASHDVGRIPSYDAGVGFSESVDIYGTYSASERCLIETVEDLSQKLERFKVITLEVGGIGQEVKEEEKK